MKIHNILNICTSCLGLFGISPWGSVSQFQDTSAYWISNVPGGATNAPQVKIIINIFKPLGKDILHILQRHDMIRIFKPYDILKYDNIRGGLILQSNSFLILPSMQPFIASLTILAK